MQRSSRNYYEFIGRTAWFDDIKDREHLRFAINEYPNENAHRNNQGYMTIEIHAKDEHGANGYRNLCKR